MKLSQLFKLREVEEEIEKKIKSNVKRYLHAIKSINEDKSVKKNNQKFSLKNIFFNSDGTSIVILNENLLREISNQGLQISLSPHQNHQSELNESIDDNNIISFHDSMPPFYNESLLLSVTILEFPPDFVISNMLTCRSFARISIVLGEQKPA